MEQIKLLNLDVIAKKYWRKLLLINDRDRLKMSMYPDRDWEHLIIFFFSIVLVFISVSGYLYLKTNNTIFSAQQTIQINTAEEGKIKNTVETITKAETSFNGLLEKESEVKDPSR